ncbi:uncharacterized protein LOC122317079 isoform X2 [Carya illinoinensis]|uniref:WD repeat-containing protein 6 n=1 Tax=Carya illinoinensis TaxID=32201 RepID=A0A922D6T1_CARIL|nr:uncharacterized protein LOC122317079 isoform X2 [Carya illinoinensis]KAG6619439.1 hypothetical protein I3842_Q098600 [Carya illinoinensis]
MAEPPTEWRLQSGQYLGEISALCFLHLPSHVSSLPYLLAGSGSQILLYSLDSGQLIRSFHVFQGIRVHGIACNDSINCAEGTISSKLAFQLAVFGERRVKLFSLMIDFGLKPQNGSGICVNLNQLHLLPKFNNWVLDVCFLKGLVRSLDEGSHCLAIGCSDNSVLVWDILSSSVVLQVQSPERCLLYSLRLWGDNIEALQIASGTIFNEILVWKVVSQNDAPSLANPMEDHIDQRCPFYNNVWFHCRQFEAVHICKLAGHEGSIFRIAWSSDGRKLVSVSDDRSARVWTIHGARNGYDKPGVSIGPDLDGFVLFGHNARVWDCCISDFLIVTVGEDCTCRMWGLDGKQLQMIKEHIGRGIWRCLYDAKFSLLVTAGFDSAIKVHQLHGSLSGGLHGHAEVKEFIDGMEIFTVRIPNTSEHCGLTDSKSEYVRCLHFTSEDTLYVATNRGYLYHTKVSNTRDVKWTELVCVSKEVPIVCMDVLSNKSSELCGAVEDWVAVGDGRGYMTIARVFCDSYTPEVSLTFTWPAGIERQLLGTYWCKSLGYRYIFTTDPKGMLKLWRLCGPSPQASHNSSRSYNNVSLVGEFASCFGNRVLCLNASFEKEVLVCGDVRGNLVLFPLLKDLLLNTSVASKVKISPINYFKGVHGISSVSSVSFSRLSSEQIEICSTGGDGCICNLEYDRDHRTLEFIGMKQVKELSLIQSVSADNDSLDNLASGCYAAGFASVDFIIWNLITETKVVQIPCGGWRRPHSYYLGDVPEMQNCFAYVKDEMIYIHRNWTLDGERRIIPQNLHVQFHGREMHTLCFVSELRANDLFSRSIWIATGCEDGTVRLTRYTADVANWSASKLLGEHVGGSAVRSICFASEVHIVASEDTNIPDGRSRQTAGAGSGENPFLLISVGAKRVLTSWLLRNRKHKEETVDQQYGETGNSCKPSSGESSSMSFQWLSTDMPARYSSSDYYPEEMEKVVSATENVHGTKVGARSFFRGKGKMDITSGFGDKYEDDWRYLAVTAFLVKCPDSRLTVCFVVVACSDATLVLRALILPCRLWFDVALLVPLSSPVLALQHVIIPICLPSEDNSQKRSVFIVISGATDGSIAFWDLTGAVEAFMRRLSTLQVENFIDCQKRPRTGRGSQGGRWWRSLSNSISKRKPGYRSSVTMKAGDVPNSNMLNQVTNGTEFLINDSGSSAATCSNAINTASLEPPANVDDSPSEICEIGPLHVLSNVHQSGVNCLRVSDIRDCQNSLSGLMFNIISGGDDQALYYLRFKLSLIAMVPDNEFMAPDIRNSNGRPESTNTFVNCGERQVEDYEIKFLYHEKIASAHSSAVKGVWTDGSWVFSTGLDQRVRCWLIEKDGKLTEHAYLVVSVPEPEALDARVCGRNHYQIAVAGRGMQIFEFAGVCETDHGK